MMKLLIPEGRAHWAEAARVFADLWCAVTGKTPATVTQDDGESDIVCFGTDADSVFIHTLLTERKITDFPIRFGTDSYLIRSAAFGKRNFLFLAGGNVRAAFYAVYDFFERAAGCHYFWDGDVIPKKDSIPIDGWDVRESPRFEYRGLRYFAHRSLTRFQAEHWDFDDWKKEFDWVLKKRLNLAMLRIGIDDLFQKAFPDVVPYPDATKPLPEHFERSFNDRTLFWPLEYRGELRKKVLAYGRSRGLFQPEDCGTMSHWYSRTPNAFLEHFKPDFVPQANKNYHDPTGLVWDITKDENMDRYFALTQAHVKHYGDGQIFHTIGLAERLCYLDRTANHEMKLYAYRRIIGKLRESYPHAPLLIASWDFISTWTHDEVKALIAELDPSNTVILDYTSDIYDDVNNFRNWGIVGKSPWIFGIFHAFEASNEIRGMYDKIADRFPVAAEDPMCKGVVYWPENSHSDTLMLDYFPAIAWNPAQYKIDSFIPGFCRRRYPAELAPEMTKFWLDMLPAIKACCWGGLQGSGPQREVYPDLYFTLGCGAGVWAWAEIDATQLEYNLYKFREMHGHVDAVASVLKRLAKLDFNTIDAFTKRDVFDLARTAFSRVMTYAMAKFILMLDTWCTGARTCFWSTAEQKNVNGPDGTAENLLEHMKNMRSFARCLTALLESSGEFSLNCALADLKRKHTVNPVFPETLKGNAEVPYCRSFIFELAKECYEPALAEFEKFLKERVQADDRRLWNGLTKTMLDRFAPIREAYYAKPLEAMAPDIAGAFKRLPQTLEAMAELALILK